MSCPIRVVVIPRDKRALLAPLSLVQSHLRRAVTIICSGEPMPGPFFCKRTSMTVSFLLRCQYTAWSETVSIDKTNPRKLGTRAST